MSDVAESAKHAFIESQKHALGTGVAPIFNVLVDCIAITITEDFPFLQNILEELGCGGGNLFDNTTFANGENQDDLTVQFPELEGMPDWTGHDCTSPALPSITLTQGATTFVVPALTFGTGADSGRKVAGQIGANDWLLTGGWVNSTSRWFYRMIFETGDLPFNTVDPIEVTAPIGTEFPLWTDIDTTALTELLSGEDFWDSAGFQDRWLRLKNVDLTDVSVGYIIYRNADNPGGNNPGDVPYPLIVDPREFVITSTGFEFRGTVSDGFYATDYLGRDWYLHRDEDYAGAGACSFLWCYDDNIGPTGTNGFLASGNTRGVGEKVKDWVYWLIPLEGSHPDLGSAGNDTAVNTKSGSYDPGYDSGGNTEVPPLDAISNQVMDSNDTLNIPIDATGGTLNITLDVAELPSFCTFMDNGDGTGDIDCTTGNFDDGTYQIYVLAINDGNPIRDQRRDFQLTVNPP